MLPTKQAIRKIINRLGYDIRRISDKQLVYANGDTGKLSHPASGKTQSDFSTLTIQEIENIVHRDQEIKLHVGCGPRVLKGWINIDLKYVYYGKGEHLKNYTDKYYPPEMRGDQRDLLIMDVTKSKLPFADNSISVIFHEDFIEHLNQRDQFCFLAETYRVLKPGAVHRVNTPNLAYWMDQQSEFEKGMQGVFVDLWDQWKHFHMLSPLVLEEMAQMVGYSEVRFTQRDQSCSALVPLEYRPNPTYAPEEANIFADLVK